MGVGHDVSLFVNILDFGLKFIFGAVFWKSSIDLS